VGGGFQLGPLGTSATNWPIVPAPGDYEDGEFGGMMVGRENRSTRRKCAPVPFVHHKSYVNWSGANPGRRGGKPATNRFSYGTAIFTLLVRCISVNTVTIICYFLILPISWHSVRIYIPLYFIKLKD
jgi:hypothetical protein